MADPQRPLTGKVWLLGAGPGDPELMTLKGQRILRSAEVVVYDALVGEGVVAMIPPTARCIYAGKQSSRHTLPQEGINALLAELAREGLQVVRLKGGDPFVFGRGGEELEYLAQQGIPFEVVPGVTAATGCAAYSGFPLTHRDHAQAVTLITGHLKDGTVDLDWPSLARTGHTLVFYMGVGAIDAICRQLVRHGMPPDTPAAAVEKGTLPEQRTVRADLATLAQRVHEAGVSPPALIIIGSVVGLRDSLSWFEKETP